MRPSCKIITEIKIIYLCLKQFIKFFSFNYKIKVKQDYYYYEKFLSISLIKGFVKILYKTFYSNIQTAFSTTSSSSLLLDYSGCLGYKVNLKIRENIIFHFPQRFFVFVSCQVSERYGPMK